MEFTGIDSLDGLVYERDKVLARKSELEHILQESSNERTKELLRTRLNELDKLHMKLATEIVIKG